MSSTGPRSRRQRPLSHQCPTCRRHWALHVVDHPSGGVVLCRWCGALRTDTRVSLPQQRRPDEDRRRA